MLEVKGWLERNYDCRFDIDPFKFEEVVASVFGDVGYAPRVTARSRDGGIDVVLDGHGDSLIAVQVKRYRNVIQVEQLRAFTGAMMANGCTRGFFATTSGFTRGAAEYLEQLGNVDIRIGDASFKGIKIELFDAERFFDALGIARRRFLSGLVSGDNQYVCPEFLELPEK